MKHEQNNNKINETNICVPITPTKKCKFTQLIAKLISFSNPEGAGSINIAINYPSR